MAARHIICDNQKILIISAIYDKIEKLEIISTLIKNYQYIILLGNICYPFNNLQLVEKRINKLQKYLDKYPNLIYILGNYDLDLWSKLKNHEISNWILSKPNVGIFNFPSQSNIVATSGGIPENLTKKQLNNNLEISFVSNLEGKPWQEIYGGNLGYVISNNPISHQNPRFFNYAAAIGQIYDENHQVWAQEADQYGLKKTFII